MVEWSVATYPNKLGLWVRPGAYRLSFVSLCILTMGQSLPNVKH